MNTNLYTASMDDTWDKICRLCSEEKNEMLPIFSDEALQRRIIHKLRACLPVLVYKTDPLPKQICQFCAARLDDAYEFREYCLNVYRNMHAILLKYKQTTSTQIFLDAMRNSSDPCQVQLCKEKSRAPPPLVPLSPFSTILPLNDLSIPINQTSQDHLQGMETLSELPCEVEIKEMNMDQILCTEAAVCDELDEKSKLSGMFDANMQAETQDMMSDIEKVELENQDKKEEKRTSILEQVLTGNLTMNNHQRLQSRTKLTSEWWCAPCNSYFKTKDSLVKHMQLYCPRIYSCRKCSASFESVSTLAKHEADSHLKVKLDFTNNLNDCNHCERQFVSWEMLKQHRLHDHLAESTKIGNNMWCSLCNRSFLTIKSYQSHIQLHQTKLMPQNAFESAVTQIVERLEEMKQNERLKEIKRNERLKEIKRDEQYYENVKSLMCPTCGKICTQQSALSNHMRTHQPKKHKCEICGRSFGLFIRLASHKIAEHNEQSVISPAMSAVEQEEALNAEREAREAKEAKNRGIKRSYSEIIENNVSVDDKSFKHMSTGHKNVARCGICSQSFSDHTTMLKHLQTHSDSFCKNYVCHVCKKPFKEQSQLLKHEACHKRLVHDNVSLYTSAVSNNSITDKMHQQIMHTVNKTYHCAKCNKIFFKEVSLLAHQCTKQVTAKSQRKVSSHAGNKMYECSKCDATFASSQSRNAHMKMHAEYMRGSAAKVDEIKLEPDDESMPKLRPEALFEYNVSPIEPKIEINEQSTPPPLKRTLIKTANGHRCGVCQSPFVSRELAVAHLRSAHPVMPYQCPYCKKRFTTQYTFTHHIKTEHPDEPEK